MARERILTRLQQLTGKLKPGDRTTANDLNELQKALVTHLARDENFVVSGERLHHEGAEHLEATRETSFERFAHLDSIIDASIADEEAGVAPLVFRRATAFQSNLIGNSVPVWGSGLAVSNSFGPFIDEHGLGVWFDFFFPKRMISVYFKGNATPVLLIPVSGTIFPTKTYHIQAGSVWIASNLIVNDPTLAGYYTGLKVSGGSLDLSIAAEVDGDTIIFKIGSTGTLSLNLDQNKVTTTSPDAGFNAAAADVKLPKTCSLKLSSGGGQLTAADASCTVFGSEANFKFSNSNAVWIAPISQILVPYKVTTTRNTPNIFAFQTSDSLLSNFEGEAKIEVASGWLLPAAKVAPQQLGQASGTGALVIGLSKGVTANWKGLKSGDTRLTKPAIIAEPGLVTVADFFAENTRGRLKWTLWENANSPHHSDITLTYGKAFPFIYVSAAAGNEAVVFFCKHKASFDRPVDANGSPFVIESTIALASISQNGKKFRAVLFDNDLLFDGNPTPKSFEICAVALRNAFFNTTRPYSVFLTGALAGDNQLSDGMVALSFGIYRYLPTLPDPYVSNISMGRRFVARGVLGNVGMGLVGFVKWPNPPEVHVDEEGNVENPAYVYFRFAPVDQSLLLGQASALSSSSSQPVPQIKNFQVGVRAFNRNIVSDAAVESARLPAVNTEQTLSERAPSFSSEADLSDLINQTSRAEDRQTALRFLAANPATKKVKNIDALVNAQAIDLAHAGLLGGGPPVSFTARDTEAAATSRTRGAGILFSLDAFILLDVSSNADQMGVAWGTSIKVDRDTRGNATLSNVGTSNFVPGSSQLPLQILNMDVVSVGHNLRAITLPQVSSEPISNIPLDVEGPVAGNDNITVTPGILVYQNDGLPTRIGSESPYQVPIAPIPVTKHFVKEFNDKKNPRLLQSIFSLPFAIIAQANFERKPHADPEDGSRISFNRPFFEQLRGGLQIKSLAPKGPSPDQSGSFEGWTLQLDETINTQLFGVPLNGQLRTSFFALPVNGSTLGQTVKKIFNKEFRLGGNKPKVPVEKIEFSGYGASMFSNWLDGGAAIAEVSQTLFEVLVGRCAHEVVQVRSILYPWGVHVVRTITLLRSANGYVFRSDSGWKAESDGFFDFAYKINFENPPDIPVANPYEVHHDIVKGISNVREIKDYAAASPFKSSFKLNDPNLPPEVKGLSVAQWKALYQGKIISNKDFVLDVEMQAVVFDADVHLNDVTLGGVVDPVYGDFKSSHERCWDTFSLRPPGF